MSTLESLLPLLLHPNRQIRIQASTFLVILSNPSTENQPEEEKKGEELSRRVVINRAPLFSQEEFYCFIRPKLLQYAVDRDDDLLELSSASALLARLRPPLSLATMRKYFLELSKEPDFNVMMTMEENFTKNADLPDSDSWAMNFLGEYFKERLRKIKNYQKQQQVQQAMKTKKQ